MLKPDENALLCLTGPDTPMGDLFRSFWIPVALSEEIPAPDSPPVQVKVLGEELVLFRDSRGRIGLLEEFCPHRTASLFYGRNEECGLRCVYHGWKFDVDGNCVDMPNEPPESDFRHKVKAQSYATTELGNVIWAYMGPKDRAPEPPQMEWALLPDAQRYITKIRVECNYLQGMEGDIDSSHSAFLHSTTKGEIDRRGANQIREEQLRKYSFQDKAPKFFISETDYGLAVGARRNADEEHYYWRITQWLMPSYALTPREQGQVLQCNMRIPIDDHHHWFFRAAFHPTRSLSAQELYEFRFGGNTFSEVIPGTYIPVANKSNHFLIDRSVQKSLTFTGIKGIPTQDGAVAVSMGPVAQREKERLGTSDLAIIAARRRLKEAVRQLQESKPPYAAAHGAVYRVRGAALLLKRDVPFDEGARELTEVK